MKTFRKHKSPITLKQEVKLQKIAGKAGISPQVIDKDLVSKYIVMTKMDYHLIDVMKKQKGILKQIQQKQILEIFKKLDEIGIFHADANILNYMIKDGKIYIIDFGMSKIIDDGLIKKLGTSTPNLNIMTLGLVLKLKELGCPSESYKTLKKLYQTKIFNSLIYDYFSSLSLINGYAWNKLLLLHRIILWRRGQNMPHSM